MTDPVAPMPKMTSFLRGHALLRCWAQRQPPTSFRRYMANPRSLQAVKCMCIIDDLSMEVFGKNMKPRHGVVVKRHPKWNHDKFAFPALWNMAIDVTCACQRGVSHAPMGRSRSRYKHVSGFGPAASVNSQILYTRPLCIVQMSLLSLATSPAVYVYIEAEMYARKRRVSIR